MSDAGVKWFHAGISTVKEKDESRVIRIPDRLFKEEDILRVGDPVYWSYEKLIGILVVSNQRLTGKEEYKTVGYRTLQDESNSHECVIPKQFFEDYRGRGEPKAAQPVREKARVEVGERRHFMYHSEMVESQIRSCYLFTDEQFDQRFSDSDIWDGDLSGVPRFTSP